MAKILWIVSFLLGKKKRKEGGFAGEFVYPEPPIRLFLEARHVSLDGDAERQKGLLGSGSLALRKRSRIPLPLQKPPILEDQLSSYHILLA